MERALALRQQGRILDRVAPGQALRANRDHARDVARAAHRIAEQREALAQDFRLEPRAVACDLLEGRRRHRNEVRVACDRLVDFKPALGEGASHLRHVRQKIGQCRHRRHCDTAIAVLHGAAGDIFELLDRSDHRALGLAHVAFACTAHTGKCLRADAVDYLVRRDEAKDVGKVREQHQQACGDHAHREQKAAARQQWHRPHVAAQCYRKPDAQHSRQDEERHHCLVHAVAHEELRDAVRVAGCGELDDDRDDRDQDREHAGDDLRGAGQQREGTGVVEGREPAQRVTPRIAAFEPGGQREEQRGETEQHGEAAQPHVTLTLVHFARHCFPHPGE